VFTNPDKDGFFDSISMFFSRHEGLNQKIVTSHALGTVLGDPVNGSFAIFSTDDGGDSWNRRGVEKRSPKGSGCAVGLFTAKKGESAFAAGNGSLVNPAGRADLFVTGGSVARLGYTELFSMDGVFCHESTHFIKLPLASGESAGAFALASPPIEDKAENYPNTIVVVGGDYKKPDNASNNAAIITHVELFFRTVRQPTTPPHGYRSAVAYDAASKTWITVGPNGTDISNDDGRNWRALEPLSGQPQDADQHWNALALPFVVGPHGRIGVLDPAAFK
jgi:hypothetical protein